MKKNTQAFSLVMAIGIVILITLLAFLILEYIIPFGRNVKGIENSSKAYYQAQSGIEQALLEIATQEAGYSNNTNNTEVISYNYNITGSGQFLPPVGKGNSEYDPDWNIIAAGQPIQLKIGNGDIEDWNSARFHFRVPNIGQTTNEPTLQGGDAPIINWQISSNRDLITATGSSFITATEINNYDEDGINMSDYEGTTLESGDIGVEEFYNQDLGTGETECGNNKECTLRFFIVNQLILQESGAYSSGTLVPYIEWMFDFGDDAQVPLRYADIETTGTSYGFKKDLQIKIPQQTIVEAFDFTVFQ